MIAFVVPVSDEARYEEIAAPSLEAVREPDSPVMAPGGEGPPQPRLNAALEELAVMPDLEAAVIIHEDVRLLDPQTAAIVRRTFSDPDIAIAGVMGAQGVSSLAWWEGVNIGRTASSKLVAGEVVGVAGAGEVDAVDGIVLCLSPWAVRTLRFDESLAADFHGYDVDLCFQARYHGRRVEVIPMATAHEYQPLFTDTERWKRNQLRFERRWLDHRMITEARHRALG